MMPLSKNNGSSVTKDTEKQPGRWVYIHCKIKVKMKTGTSTTGHNNQ